jgi:hypothetical protein
MVPRATFIFGGVIDCHVYYERSSPPFLTRELILTRMNASLELYTIYLFR